MYSEPEQKGYSRSNSCCFKQTSFTQVSTEAQETAHLHQKLRIFHMYIAMREHCLATYLMPIMQSLFVKNDLNSSFKLVVTHQCVHYIHKQSKQIVTKLEVLVSVKLPHWSYPPESMFVTYMSVQPLRKIRDEGIPCNWFDK